MLRKTGQLFVKPYYNVVVGGIVALVTLVALPSCKKKTDTANDVGVGGLIKEDVTTPATINFWQFWSDPGIKPTMERMVADFQKANPGITVNMTDLTWESGHEKIVIALSSGSGPDLLELGSDWIAEFAANKHLAELTANLGPSKTEFLGWDPVTYQGRLYGQPWILGTRTLFYNAELLKRAGFDEKSLPVTLTELHDLIVKVNKLGKPVRGWGSNAAERHRLYKKFLPFFWSFGADFYSQDGAYCVISSMYAGKALKYYKALHDSCAYVDTQRGLEDAFLDGKIGVILSGEWLLKRIHNERPDFRFFTGLFPGQQSFGRSFLGGEYLTINSHSPNKSAALKLLRYLSSPENQVLFCKANFSTCPSSVVAARDSFFTSDPNVVTFVKQLRLSNSPPVEPTWVYIEDEFEKAIERCLFENEPIYETLHNARNAIQKISRPNAPSDSAAVSPS